MKIVKAPNDISNAQGKTLFLGGSIEMGNAPDWQSELTNHLSELDITILNPRRDDWDSTWTQSINNPQFKEQVDWELSALEQADLIVFWFSEGTISPITLLELGLFGPNRNCLVYCPDGYFRKGNVDIVCQRYGILQVGGMDDVIDWVKGNCKNNKNI